MNRTYTFAIIPSYRDSEEKLKSIFRSAFESIAIVPTTLDIEHTKIDYVKENEGASNIVQKVARFLRRFQSSLGITLVHIEVQANASERAVQQAVDNIAAREGILIKRTKREALN